MVVFGALLSTSYRAHVRVVKSDPALEVQNLYVFLGPDKQWRPTLKDEAHFAFWPTTAYQVTMIYETNGEKRHWDGPVLRSGQYLDVDIASSQVTSDEPCDWPCL